jgi:hypothetical protein
LGISAGCNEQERVLDPVFLPRAPGTAGRVSEKGSLAGYCDLCFLLLIVLTYTYNPASTSTDKEEEVFSWEDDDDEDKVSSPTTTITKAAPAVVQPSTPSETLAAKAIVAVPVVAAATPKAPVAEPAASVVSPRHSSEGSYDVVSSNVSASEEPKDDNDEDEDEDEDEEEEDEEEDSDWE